MNVFYQTERLILNILPPLWAPAVLNFYKNNKDVLEGVEPARNSRFYTESFQKANLSVEYNSFFKNNYMRYWIFDKKNPDFPIGTICFSNFLKGAFKSCMVGYKLDKNHTGNGYMTEALRFLLPELCHNYPLHRIEAYVMPDNTGSIRLLNNLGFVKEGYLHSFAKINDKWEDHLLYTYFNG